VKYDLIYMLFAFMLSLGCFYGVERLIRKLPTGRMWVYILLLICLASTAFVAFEMGTFFGGIE
jgi:hypothetical protein